MVSVSTDFDLDSFDGRYRGPFPGQQTKFVERTEREVFFGGAGGGGKSVNGMGKFGQQLAVEHRRYEDGQITNSKAWGLYLRRTMPDLRQAIDRSHQIFTDIDPDATYNVNDHIWTFPSCANAHFQFGHMESEASKYKYKSSEFTYVFLDELTEFTETMYEYIDTRIRTSDPVLAEMLQLCSASNPDGPGLLWVRKRFIEGKTPEVTYRKQFRLRDGRIKNYDSVFIPARLEDNPVLLAQGSYEASLLNKRPEVREAILNGNWYVNAGAFLANIWDSAMHVCPNHDIPKNAFKFRMCDPGLTAPSSVMWAYVDREECITIFHALNVRNHDAPMLAGRIREIEQYYGLWDDEANESMLNGPIDEDAFSRNLAGGPSYAKLMRDCGIRWVRSNKDRFNGTAEVVRRLNARVKPIKKPGEEAPPLPDRPMLRFMERCKSPIETLPILQADPNDPNDVDTKGNDHDWDAVRYGCMYRRLFGGKEQADDDDDNIVDISQYRKRGNGGSGGPMGTPPGGW